MDKYVVVVEETVAEEFEVCAESKEEALDSVASKYWSGDFVLEPGELHYAQMAIVSPREASLTWVEL